MSEITSLTVHELQQKLKRKELTIAEIQGTKYVQIYLTEEELQKKETKDLVKKYKQEKYSVAIFVSGKENYPEILEKIITKQVGLNRNVC